MKIALANNLYPPFERGGAETVVVKMAADYRAQGHEVFLFTTRPLGKEVSVPQDLKIYYFPSRFYSLAGCSTLSRLLWHLGDLFAFRKYFQAKKILRAEKPDILITHNLTGLGFLLPAAARKLKIRHEHFLHDIQLLHPSGLMFYGQENMISSLLARLYQALTRSCLASPAKVISPSRWLLDLHCRHGFFPDSDTEIRPFAPLANQPAKPRDVTSHHRETIFLFVGQIETHKGIFFLIETFRKLPGHARLKIVGDGAQLVAAKKIAADDLRIEFLGRRPLAETKEIMATSDCLVVPSLCYENSPTVIPLAHQAGLKVIASDLGGIPEIMGPGDRLFKPGDSIDLLEKLKTA